MSISFAFLKHLNLAISIKIHVTIWQTVYIYMTAISTNLIPWTMRLLSWYLPGCIKELRALRGKFGPLWSQKLKFAFHQIIQMLYKKKNLSVKFWHLLYFYRCYGNKNGRQNRLEIEYMQILDQMLVFWRPNFKELDISTAKCKNIYILCVQYLFWACVKYILVFACALYKFLPQCLKFESKLQIYYFQPILAAIFVAIALVKR